MHLVFVPFLRCFSPIIRALSVNLPKNGTFHVSRLQHFANLPVYFSKLRGT